MERHELINKYEKRLQKENPARIEQLYFEFRRDLTELEQTKVEVPEFVAEWIEECKEKGKSLLKSLLYTPEKVNSWVDNSENQELFANAWSFGYTIEKEKKYKIVMLNIASSGGVLTRIEHDDSWIWIDTLGTIVEGRTHTRKELEEAGFGWVFDCPGIKIEEVTE